MSKPLPLIALFLFLSSFAHSQEDLHLRWQALIYQVDIEGQLLNQHCPNFPTEAMDQAGAHAAVMLWLSNYPDEAIAFFETEEVARLNPSTVHFGLESPSSPGFNHPYWQWAESAGLSGKDIRGFAAHFPLPQASFDSEAEVKAYDLVLQDWMRLYPKELERFLNHSALAAKNPYYEPSSIQDHGVVERFLLIPCPEEMPLRNQYDSGNPALDQERFDLALQHWYYVNDQEKYLELYDVESPHENIEGQK